MSLFYTRIFNTRYPIPFVAFERLSEILDIEKPIEGVIQTLIETCGKTHPISEEDITYFLTRYSEHTQDKELPKEVTGDEKPQTLTKGVFFQRFLSAQDSATLLLMATGYNYAQAEFLYCKADVKEAEKVIKTYLAFLSEQNNILYESVLYGFGGGYKEEKQEEGAIDGNSMTIEQLNAMQHR